MLPKRLARRLPNEHLPQESSKLLSIVDFISITAGSPRWQMPHGKQGSIFNFSSEYYNEFF